MDLVEYTYAATRKLSHDFLGGPKWLKFNWVINFQKGMTWIWVLGLMLYFDHFSPQAWVYLLLHGSYGILWLLKDMTIPDRKWQVRITWGGGIMAVLAVLGPYWVAPYLLISPVLGENHQGATWFWLCVAVVLYVFGVMLMIGADAQKFRRLQKGSGLITDGYFKLIRHPNYLGEMMIYAAFALVVWHWIPWLILLWVWLGYFSINILMKERSLSRYPEWTEYKQRTYYLIPFLW